MVEIKFMVTNYQKNDGQFKNDSRSNKTAKIAKKIENVDFEY